MRINSALDVNLNLLQKNVEKLQARVSSEIIFMVKADAYGHGLVPITRFANESLGINEFGLASAGEALELRKELGSLNFEAITFSDVQIDHTLCSDIYLNREVIPVISTLNSLQYFLKNDDFKNFPLYLKINTGMNRLGISMNSLELVSSLIKKSGRKSIAHLMTHFGNASLSMKTNKRNLLQLANFEQAKKELRSRGLNIEKTSIANSGAIEQGIGLEESHIRPGLMLYGPSSMIPKYKNESWWDGDLISSLRTKVITVFEADRGMPIGYGSTPIPEQGRIAILALGYGDGFSTRYQGVELEHGNSKGKIIGRVNMDMFQVLFPKKESLILNEGDNFTVWDNFSPNFNTICQQSQSIPYEVFLSLSKRVPRNYIY